MKKLFSLIAAACSIVANAQDIVGAGATFPAPLYSKWAAEYNKATNIKVNYQSVGSGAGIKQVESGTVTFGASDMPLTDEKLKESGLFQFPTVIGGVVPVINIKGIEAGKVRLTGQVLADIYLGKITTWTDPAIRALNPGVNLPSEQITAIRRADGSGTTFIWTNYLSKVNPEFKQKIGEGTAVNWITGAGGKGNEGVAAFVAKIPNSVGYVEYAYVKQNKMTYVQVQNAAGNWVYPTEDTFKAASANVDWSKSYYQILTNQPGKEAWPITGATFILMHKKPQDPKLSKQAVQFFDWAYTNGAKAADDLDYVMLPDSVKAHIKAGWKTLGLN